jgi:hypothetical protein
MRSVIQYGSSSIQYRRRSSSEVTGHVCPEPLQSSSTNCWLVTSLSLAPGTREPVYRLPERRREVRLQHRSVRQTGFQSRRSSRPGTRPFSLPRTLGLNWPSPEVQRERRRERDFGGRCGHGFPRSPPRPRQNLPFHAAAARTESGSQEAGGVPNGIRTLAPSLNRNARFYLAFVLDCQWVHSETQKCPGSAQRGSGAGHIEEPAEHI